ncbi:catalase [Streptomyces sp. AC536]|uniref:catalase n=1 Tax=Streptomyces buecherae TaxID=2763006 RepID=UPI00164EA63A|nr:catalase [Streptomyces buecherae]MBC3983462.1 catalase [Streptomyces buecherae]QNJ39027.1 catalase [Streptomyces buecherae]
MTDVSSLGSPEDDPQTVLTDRQGHPIYDNQNQRTVGARGPATLENYHFLEKISHFDRERIPERVVHARGVTSYGYFEAYGAWGDEPISQYTRAKLFQERGKRTDVAVRFSTVIGGRDSSEAARDPRGFAVKFYTEDGNWDLVGNNLGVFFIRDAVKFPDVIHALKPDPVSHEQKPARIFDFMSQTPESMHMLVNLFSPRGIPADYRHMQGFGVNTYKWIDAEGQSVLVKYHWMPKQGVRSMTEEDAANVQAGELGHATKDLYEAIRRGEYPEWELLVQMMADGDHPELDFDPLDDTKTWPEQDFPPKPVGRLVLDRTVDNYYAENEQIAFGTGVLVDGLDFSDDKMLVGRTFSYSDTQRYRVGPNYLQLPVNQAKNTEVRTNQRDGFMAYDNRAANANPEVNYEPSITGGLHEAQYPTHDDQGPEIRGRLTRKRIPLANDYQQAGQRYLLLEDWERDDLVTNFVNLISQCDRRVQERMVWHFLLVENDLGLRVGKGLGIGPSDVTHLEPLPGQSLTDEDRERLSRLGENPPRDVSGLTMTHCVPDERYVVTR